MYVYVCTCISFCCINSGIKAVVNIMLCVSAAHKIDYRTKLCSEGFFLFLLIRRVQNGTHPGSPRTRFRWLPQSPSPQIPQTPKTKVSDRTLKPNSEMGKSRPTRVHN